MSIVDELERRNQLWGRIRATPPAELNASLLRELRVYGGAQGIWLDSQVTSKIVAGVANIAVSILHTGEHYPDDLSEEGLIYHYPDTRRGPGRDRSEIEATKAAGELKLPIFVILSEPSDDTLRKVRLGWVSDWDDASKQFLVLFGDGPPVYQTPPTTDQPFVLHEPRQRKITQVKVRVGQQKFRFQVLKQYGAKCCVCSITVPELLAAAHICGKEHCGSDDWRNGIPLCHTHHAAFDAGMFAINPASLQIEIGDGLTAPHLCLTEAVLQPMRGRPHLEALHWRYKSERKSAPTLRFGADEV